MKSKEDNLFINLPEFIQGKLKDRLLCERIENELESNANFRREYDDMKHFFEQRIRIDEQDAPQGYFSTLLPQILEKIDTKSAKKKFSISNLYHGWRLATVLSVIVMLVIYFRIVIFDGEKEPQIGITALDSGQNPASLPVNNVPGDTSAGENRTKDIKYVEPPAVQKEIQPDDESFDINSEELTLSNDVQEDSMEDLIDEISGSEVDHIIEKINNLNL